MNDEKKFPPTRYINVGRRNTAMAQAYDARAEISKDMEWDVYISIDEVTHILSEERARFWKAIELAIQDGAKFIGGAAGAAFSETSPSVYIEKSKANLKSQPTEDKRGEKK